MAIVVHLPLGTNRSQEEPLGEADAIALSRDWVGERDLAIIYPDSFYFPALGALRHL